MSSSQTPAKKLGARSRQEAALAIMAIPVLIHLRMKPSERMMKKAEWGFKHGLTKDDFNPRGVKHG